MGDSCPRESVAWRRGRPASLSVPLDLLIRASVIGIRQRSTLVPFNTRHGLRTTCAIARSSTDEFLLSSYRECSAALRISNRPSRTCAAHRSFSSQWLAVGSSRTWLGKLSLHGVGTLLRWLCRHEHNILWIRRSDCGEQLSHEFVPLTTSSRDPSPPAAPHHPEPISSSAECNSSTVLLAAPWLIRTTPFSLRM